DVSTFLSEKCENRGGSIICPCFSVRLPKPNHSKHLQVSCQMEIHFSIPIRRFNSQTQLPSTIPKSIFQAETANSAFEHHSKIHFLSGSYNLSFRVPFQNPFFKRHALQIPLPNPTLKSPIELPF